MVMVVAAPPAALRFSRDDAPGIRRLGGARVRYVGPDGRAVRCVQTLARIRALAIPPAWVDVWVCADADGHIQATGRDAKGRKQYRYHAEWHRARGDTKYVALAAFGRALPRLRAVVEADLSRPGLPREKVLAAVVRLIDLTHLRVGNRDYALQNGSFGLSTLKDQHATIDGGTVRLKFRGKSGVWYDRALQDRRLAKIVRACRDLPGQHLFQYAGDDGEPHAVGSCDVNGYIRSASGGDFTAKVFRTWEGTVAAAVRLAALDAPASEAAGKRAVADVIKAVAAELGNTPAVCRKSYVHPAVVDAYLAGGLALPRRARRAGLSPDEAAVLAWLTKMSG